MAIFIVLSRYVCLIYLVVHSGGHTNRSQPITTYWNYAKENQSSILPFMPKRLGSSAWTNVPDTLTCAKQSLSTYPNSKGFLHNTGSGLCRPLLWLQGSNAQGALQVQPEEGDLYLSIGVCGGEFTIFEFGSSGELACLKYDEHSRVTMAEAETQCQALGYHLIQIKTLSKLELVRSYVTYHAWIGLRYLRAADIYVWTLDGKLLTTQEINEVFNSGEPNNYHGEEDCGSYDKTSKNLNDLPCYLNLTYICEIEVPA